MKVFLHICCAPCAIYPFYRLREEGLAPTGFFYNPNIHPYTEYRKRLDAVRDFSLRAALEIVYRDEYDLDEFLSKVVPRPQGGSILAVDRAGGLQETISGCA